MNRPTIALVATALFTIVSNESPVLAQSPGIAKVGQPAPLFSAVDTHGAVRSISSLKGKWVVLEWFSPDCPYTRKHYSSGNMQQLQHDYTAKGVVWLSLVSSAPGKEGYRTDDEINRLTIEKKASPTAVIRDTAGFTGHLYGARNTPQIYVIDPKGVLRYAGAVDDKPSTKAEDIPIATNYVRAALDESLAGMAITHAVTQPYGCMIQY